MSEYCQVSTTTSKRPEAERLATEFVDRRLAACVQISGPIHSTYRWQGKVENCEEWICVAKTSRERFPALLKFVQEVHPNDVPELIVTPIVDGSPEYLDWLKEQLQNG